MTTLVARGLLTGLFMLCASAASAQHFFSPHRVSGRTDALCFAGQCQSLDLMDTRNFRLRDYRQMFLAGTTPTPEDLIGTWRGVNKGVVTLVGFRQFFKEIQPTECGLFGENVKVRQVSRRWLRSCGWQPKLDRCCRIQRHDRFLIQPANCQGRFGHGSVFSYRLGGNRRLAPSRLLFDRVVKIDDNHLLGRAAVRTIVGPIPVAYFMLERIQ